MNRNILILLIIGGAVIVSGAAALMFSDGELSNVFKDGGDAEPLLVGNSAIYTADQGMGNSVVVTMVVMEVDGFVVVHEDNNGVPGDIIGADPAKAGESKNLIVTLSRYTNEGEVFHAMLHSDNGDGRFNAADDPPIRENLGAPIMMSFTIDSNAQPPQDVEY